MTQNSHLTEKYLLQSYESDQGINGAHAVSLADRNAVGVARFFLVNHLRPTAIEALALYVTIYVLTRP
jgi:hypothetical protein